LQALWAAGLLCGGRTGIPVGSGGGLPEGHPSAAHCPAVYGRPEAAVEARSRTRAVSRARCRRMRQRLVFPFRFHYNENGSPARLTAENATLGGCVMDITQLFTEKDYEEMKKMEGHTETETYRGPIIDDYVVDITHRPHRMKPGQM